MSDRTEAFWAKPEDTIAYVIPTRPDWRHRTEAIITRVRDTYDAALDLMPAIAALAALVWLMNVVPKHT